MSDSKKVEGALRDVLSALQGRHMENLVLIGGWVPFVYLKTIWSARPNRFPMTTDIDFAVRETGSLRWDETVYNRLKNSGLAMKRIYNNEPIPVQFIHKANGKPIKLDFITSFETSDDTWNRFLGHEVRENIKTYLGDEKGEGYKLLAPYVKAWVKPEKEKEDIRNTLEGILNAV